MKRTRQAARSREAVLQRQLWLSTLKSGLWYLPLVHLGYPCFAGWPGVRWSVSVPAALRRVGVALIAAGATLTGASVYTLVRYGEGTPAPHDPPRRFVYRGPYRMCRNPMELGNLLTLIGRSLLKGSPALAVASALFGSTVHAWIVLIEEPYLLRHFGAEYHTYQRRVSRWGWPLAWSMRQKVASAHNASSCRMNPVEVPPSLGLNLQADLISTDKRQGQAATSWSRRAS